MIMQRIFHKKEGIIKMGMLRDWLLRDNMVLFYKKRAQGLFVSGVELTFLKKGAPLWRFKM